MVFSDDHPDAFYDAMHFINDEIGFAMGDPQEGCLSLIRTEDGGDTWEKIGCEILPETVEGEAAFAASNSNLVIYGENIWLVSGGKKARVFRSNDLGKTWKVSETPIVQGGQMTGIFSADFYDEETGFIIGGNWEKMESNYSNKAKSVDGGKTWNLVNDGVDPGYRSCVKFIPNSKAKGLLAVGIPGVSISLDGGKSWQTISDESFYSIQVVDQHHAWLSGNKKLALAKF
jgi:photosystem II stability/assembly factor-like uncharacterized protein